MKKISLLLCLLIITLINQLQAQEQLGIRTDNYAGINGTLLNPAAHLTTPFNWDVNLAGFSFFIDNNYAFLKDTRVPELLKYRENLEFVHAPDHDPERQMRENEVMLDYFSDKRSRFLQFNTRVLGPAFYVKLGQKHAVGAYLRGRAEMNGKGISTSFSYYDYFNRPYFENFPVDDFQGSFMTWGEIALNYMYQSPTETGKFGIGITAKIIKPYEAAFFHSKDFARLAKLPGDSLSAAQINLEYGFTTSNLDLNDIQPAPNGNGLAFDIGAVITIGDEENYKWKLGASILDLGKANFNENAQFHQARIDSTISIGSDSYNSFDKLTDLEALVKTFSQEVFGDSTATLKSNEFSVWLPAAFSLQIDHAFTENIYLNATLV